MSFVYTLQQTAISREPAPYGNCQYDNDPKLNVYAEKYPVEYSVLVSVNLLVTCQIIN